MIPAHVHTTDLFKCKADDRGHRDVGVLEADPVGSGAVHPVTVDGVCPGVHVELELCGKAGVRISKQDGSMTVGQGHSYPSIHKVEPCFAHAATPARNGP